MRYSPCNNPPFDSGCPLSKSLAWPDPGRTLDGTSKCASPVLHPGKNRLFNIIPPKTGYARKQFFQHPDRSSDETVSGSALFAFACFGIRARVWAGRKPSVRYGNNGKKCHHQSAESSSVEPEKSCRAHRDSIAVFLSEVEKIRDHSISLTCHTY